MDRAVAHPGGRPRGAGGTEEDVMADLATELRWQGYSPAEVRQRLDDPPCEDCGDSGVVEDEGSLVDCHCPRREDDMSDATVVNLAGPLRNESKNTDRPTWAALLNTVADVLEGRASDVRVVSADAVVINRDDIPDEIDKVVRFLDAVAEAYVMGDPEDEGHDPESSAMCAIAAQALRLLSPAAPEDGTTRCPTCDASDPSITRDLNGGRWVTCPDAFHAAAAPEDGEPR